MTEIIIKERSEAKYDVKDDVIIVPEYNHAMITHEKTHAFFTHIEDKYPDIVLFPETEEMICHLIAVISCLFYLKFSKNFLYSILGFCCYGSLHFFFFYGFSAFIKAVFRGMI